MKPNKLVYVLAGMAAVLFAGILADAPNPQIYTAYAVVVAGIILLLCAIFED